MTAAYGCCILSNHLPGVLHDICSKSSQQLGALEVASRTYVSHTNARKAIQRDYAWKEVETKTLRRLKGEKSRPLLVVCKRMKGEREREKDQADPYVVTVVTPPPKHLGVHCLPPNMQCGETVEVKGDMYVISGVTYRYQLRKGKYEPSQRRLEVQSTGRYFLNMYLDSLMKA
eukprot:jgi/Mesen1/5442/ME000271S04463